MPFKTLSYELRDGAIAWITLQRPEVLNALDDAMKRELCEAFAQAGSDPAVRVVVLTGAGRGFCSGQDLSDALQLGELPDLSRNLRELYHPLIQQMRTLEKPILAMLHGVAAGAGLSLALACDLRLASTEARLSVAFVGIGLVPDAGCSWFLPRLVGLGRAFELAASGDRLDAETALRLGLVNRVFAPDELEAATLAWARRLAQAPTRAIGLMKRTLEQSFEHDLSRQLDLEAEAQRLAGLTEDFREGLRAFAQKRPPAFKGN